MPAPGSKCGCGLAHDWSSEVEHRNSKQHRDYVAKRLTELKHEWRFVSGQWTDGDEVGYEFECVRHHEIKRYADHPGLEDVFVDRMNTEAFSNLTEEEWKLDQLKLEREKLNSEIHSLEEKTK